MKKISRFIGKNITIEGIVGTIMQEKDDRTIISRFIMRNGPRIYSARVASRYLKYDDARGYYRIRNSYRSKVDASIKEVKPCEFPCDFCWTGRNPEYDVYRRALEKAGITCVS
ncbi:MAG: hypothetical protein HY363_04810 [Candidatus Aenigmarchaeota archaeon]|nr:hypothetical protein [Candidatus Aenigmarchaeota archaeon]